MFILTVEGRSCMNSGSYVLDLRVVQRGVFDTMIHVNPSGTGEEGGGVGWGNHLESCVFTCKLIPAEKHIRLFEGSGCCLEEK